MRKPTIGVRKGLVNALIRSSRPRGLEDIPKIPFAKIVR
ncbi:hypothetical protein SAMN04488571_11147 [Methanoculleus thermophilus]|uniref:Uncharacterized protein n=1 Tax=Methanoculleus thermophilus TaxID=2200 RepID=A0A1G9BWY6_9EURY|nr:hypothetical protein SAMN04488571_11147 [Methanoculleus thermophilus]